MATIYLSSTYEDLKDYRRVVFEALRKSGYSVIGMEDYVATDQRPVHKCLHDVERADIYVGLFAFRYGFVPPQHHNNPDGLSITELEFRRGEALKKPCITFVVNDTTPWSPSLCDAHTSEDKGERINRFRKYLLTEKLASTFSSPHELATLVLAAVRRHEEGRGSSEPSYVHVHDTPGPLTWDIEKKGSPYPGLMHFTRKYAPVFFGRDADVREILDRMRGPEGRFLIISGASGTGKSSLVDAGVLPIIENSGISGDTKYVCLRMVPSQGSHPFDALSRPLHVFTERAGLNSYEIAEDLVRQPNLLPERLHNIVSKGMNGAGLVLFLDQMEELFTGNGRRQSDVFLSALYRATQKRNIYIIATLRSDFLQYCHDHDDLLKVINGRGQIGLGPIDSISLREMIVNPAQCGGLSISKGLVRRLENEAGEASGSLPLLAFALEQLFKNRMGNELTENAYNALGGLSGAIGTQATTVEAQISKALATDANEMLTKIFASLVVVSIDGQPTRKRTLKRSFDANLQPVIEHLIQARLLFADGDGGESVISVAHEKLFEAWPTLARWVAENRDDLLVLRRAEIEAEEWHKQGRDPKFLWHVDRRKKLREVIDRFDPEQIAEPVRQFAPPRVAAIENLNDNSLSHQERLTIGQYLAALGDPRPGVGLHENGLPDIEWIDIPGGQVNLEEIENPFLVNPFRIARYLVTNMQFDSFVNAEDGYRNRRWWKKIEQSDEPFALLGQEANLPRTDVSWKEAVAFCRWLSHRMESTIRLPTEWEWQQAATGGDPTRKFPWLGGWDSTRCNSGESRLSRTTAVGVYPHGATTQGVLDMAGNVWEWCLNKYDKPEKPESFHIDDSDSQRAIRGGSWVSKPQFLRSSNRIWNFRNYTFIVIGFRLAQDLP